jgi:hypothetical protein
MTEGFTDDSDPPLHRARQIRTERRSAKLRDVTGGKHGFSPVKISRNVDIEEGLVFPLRADCRRFPSSTNLSTIFRRIGRVIRV